MAIVHVVGVIGAVIHREHGDAVIQLRTPRPYRGHVPVLAQRIPLPLNAAVGTRLAFRDAEFVAQDAMRRSFRLPPIPVIAAITTRVRMMPLANFLICNPLLVRPGGAVNGHLLVATNHVSNLWVYTGYISSAVSCKREADAREPILP